MPYYDRCRECVGRPVNIRMKDGKIHRGIIDRVDRRQVYLRPLGNRELGGFGYGFGGGFGGYRRGYGYGGYGYGGGYGIALVGIAALSLLFFW